MLCPLFFFTPSGPPTKNFGGDMWEMISVVTQGEVSFVAWVQKGPAV
jgi:hypothetical protein